MKIPHDAQQKETGQTSSSPRLARHQVTPCKVCGGQPLDVRGEGRGRQPTATSVGQPAWLWVVGVGVGVGVGAGAGAGVGVGVGVCAGAGAGVSEASHTKERQEGKQRNEEHQGVTWCTDGMISERHTESLKHLEPMHVHWMKCPK